MPTKTNKGIQHLVLHEIFHEEYVQRTERKRELIKSVSNVESLLRVNGGMAFFFFFHFHFLFMFAFLSMSLKVENQNYFLPFFSLVFRTMNYETLWHFVIFFLHFVFL
ncbi:hypothetical protein HMI55_000968 [Coelomomyces lativittatus]|nr:hypothetical protein HMI55_000968 [Coelomomyces lativittatus]